MTIRIIRFATLSPQPWKNGGGTTTEIAVSPEGAGFDDFDWRISMAEVASDGPFSRFPDIDRTLTLIEGAGMAMAIEGRPALTLTAASAPLSFPGDVPVSASLVAGPIRDFNVMTRRGRYGHIVSRHDLDAGPAALPNKGLSLIVSLGTGPITLSGQSVDVTFGDLIEVQPTNSGAIEGAHTVLVVHLLQDT